MVELDNHIVQQDQEEEEEQEGGGGMESKTERMLRRSSVSNVSIGLKKKNGGGGGMGGKTSIRQLMSEIENEKKQLKRKLMEKRGQLEAMQMDGNRLNMTITKLRCQLKAKDDELGKERERGRLLREEAIQQISSEHGSHIQEIMGNSVKIMEEEMSKLRRQNQVISRQSSTSSSSSSSTPRSVGKSRRKKSQSSLHNINLEGGGSAIESYQDQIRSLQLSAVIYLQFLCEY